MRASSTIRRNAAPALTPADPGMPGPDRAGSGAQQLPRAHGAGAGPDLPMLLTLREELRSGVWRPGTVRTQAGLRARFGETQLMATAVTRVLRDEGLVTLDGFPGVRALEPAGRPQRRTSTATDLVVEAIRKRLTDHTYQPGERMPSQQSLAIEFDTSRTTVQVALVQLRLEGLLRPNQTFETPGTYVLDPSREAREALLLADLRAAMRRGGWTRAEYPDVVERALHVLVGSAGRTGGEP
ncbi:GntR family transcriptional regulator [Streptomyces sp. CC208A]|uniref:GntR family transcriptional regulator n=1 Tax=Streptomyces sp. CC208A TaxID=3044573 RepID=UPI0024A8B6C4|nr:GntR family transcriptional regulator [Streptomyces sp. CC208A]